MHTIYRDAADILDATNAARAALVEHAKNCELRIELLRDAGYDERDSESDARYEETDDDRETERLKGLRIALFATDDAAGDLEPW